MVGRLWLESQRDAEPDPAPTVAVRHPRRTPLHEACLSEEAMQGLRDLEARVPPPDAATEPA
ncbi:hypothetical protein, partial [Cereibacter sphaeroides]|uniref:hypothetical protein n=1 Tax=Cereibacter sphaeroides TaxID=1063 RepID=UPI001F1A9C22